MKTRFFTVLIAILLVSAGCGVFGELKSTGRQPISEIIEIGPEWKEVTAPEPLRSVARIQKVSVRTEGVATLEQNDDGRAILRFTNGESGRIEATLIDDRGAEYELQIVGIGGAGGGVYLGIKHDLREGSDPPASEPDFPRDRNYPKLRIRSDVRIQCDKIEWISEIQK